MRKRIILFGLISTIILIFTPSISAIEFNNISTYYKSNIHNEIKKVNSFNIEDYTNDNSNISQNGIIFPGLLSLIIILIVRLIKLGLKSLIFSILMVLMASFIAFILRVIYRDQP